MPPRTPRPVVPLRRHGAHLRPLGHRDEPPRHVQSQLFGIAAAADARRTAPGQGHLHAGRRRGTARTGRHRRGVCEALLPRQPHAEDLPPGRLVAGGRHPKRRSARRAAHAAARVERPDQTALQSGIVVDHVLRHLCRRADPHHAHGAPAGEGPRGLWGRGGAELAVGILIPLLFLL